MPEVSGKEFFKSATMTEPESRPFKIADDQNRYIEVTLESIERKPLFDELNRLPDKFIELMLAGDNKDLDDVDDPEDIDMDLGGAEILTTIDGTTIDVFEEIFSMSATHPELTTLDMEEMATHLGFEVLFEVGGEVIDISLSDEGQLKRFQEPDSDNSS